MAATQAKLGFGTLFKRGNGGNPEVFTTIPEVRVVPPISSERELVEVTHHESPDGFREYILGLKDGSEIQIEYNYIGHEQQDGLKADHDAGTARNFQVIIPTAVPKTVSFAALVRAIDPFDPQIDGPITGRSTLKITGNIVIV